ncbi:MAG: DUF2778 domain-containing protein, partial [Cryomorphaceae bacterium]|nr:DUF2778 domain-containing protein [Cryomorphaceae bacterium]
GGITFKTSNGSGFMNASALNYDLLYSYSGNYGHQLERIDDPVNASTTYFTYNTSGSITQIDDPSQAIAQNFFWNEQQQLTGVSNQQGVHHYVYDHSGERIMKSSLINSTVYLNDQVIDDVSNLEPYTVYVNPYYVVTGLMGGDRVSKHYYMNQQRVATDITINYDPNGTGGGQQEQSLAKDPAAASPELSPALADFSEVLVGLGQKPLDTASLKLPTIESYYPEATKNPATSSSAEGNPSAPRILFWYHPDYLGNVDLITERDGYTHEFFMYNPWGEEMHQWNANTYAFTSPYRFNSKELDPETGLAYYGARYYQNKIGVWLSVDPLADQAPGWTPFRAFFNNPLRFIDPDGLFEIETGKIEKGDNLTAIAKQLNEKFKTNLTVDQIAKANNIKDVNKIKAGEFIKLPGADVELNFDLNTLKVSDANYNVDMPGLEWKGTSGREGYQNPESQNLKDKGPIPEGQYLVDPARIQSISDISSWDIFKGNFGGGTWPGLEKSWGENRTWLTPSTTTNTFGRSGFTIHGGAVPGSAGCIDLTSRNNSFHSWLKSYNKPLILNVKY